MTAERDAFEAWAKQQTHRLTREGTSTDAPYWSELTAVAWEAWQAAHSRASAVPREPTERMVLAALDRLDYMKVPEDVPAAIWRAMYDARPR